MNTNNLKCKCGKNLDYTEYHRHCIKCKDFKKAFDKLDSKLNILLKTNINNEDDLYFIKMILKIYIHQIDKRINNNKDKNSENDKKNIEIKNYNLKNIKFNDTSKINIIEEEKNNDKIININDKVIETKYGLDKKYKKNYYKNIKHGYDFEKNKDNNNIDNIDIINIDKLKIENENKNNNILKNINFEKLDKYKSANHSLNKYKQYYDNNISNFDDYNFFENTKNNNLFSSVVDKNKKSLNKSVLGRRQFYDDVKKSLSKINEDDF